MKDQIKQRIKSGGNQHQQFNLLRNELQHIILQEIDRHQGFDKMVFVGGTALRILFDLDRFSEDLDFSLSPLAQNKFEFLSLMQSVCETINSFGIFCEIKKPRAITAVHGCFLSFKTQEFIASKELKQTLAVKVEIDTNPPRGGVEQISAVKGPRLFKIRHYDLPSLFAGKLHALLFRKYTKGRDLYDYQWYLARKVSPNLTLLENAIAQTQKQELKLDTQSLKELLTKRFSEIDFEKAKEDVRSFVFDEHSLTLFEPQIFLSSFPT